MFPAKSQCQAMIMSSCQGSNAVKLTLSINHYDFSIEVDYRRERKQASEVRRKLTG